jgi:hypothetical protein
MSNQPAAKPWAQATDCLLALEADIICEKSAGHLGYKPFTILRINNQYIIIEQRLF